MVALAACGPAFAAAAVTVSLPADLTLVAGGEVDVPIALTNDVEVRALFARVTDLPDELGLVAASSACSARAGGFSCPANEAASGSINVVALSTAGDTIAAGAGAVLTFRLRDVGDPCVPGTFVTLALSDVDVSDAQSQELPATVIDGRVQCDGAATTPTVGATPTATPIPPTPTATQTPVPTATGTTAPATPTATPAPATATVTATPAAATATPTPISSATGTATPASSATPTAAATPAVVNPRARAIEKCQKALFQAGARALGRRLKIMEQCAGKVMKCVQRTAAGPKRERCIAKAGARCTAALDTLADRDEPKARAAIVAKCKPPAVLLADLLDGLGLGFAALATRCEVEHGVDLTDAAGVAACVTAVHACAAQQLVEARAPRAAELMRVAAVAPEALATMTCLADHGGDGTGVGDPRGLGKALDRCAVAIGKAGARLATGTMKSLQKCAGLVFACLQRKPGDAACLAKAARQCDKRRAKIGAEEEKLAATLARRCGEPLSFGQVAAATGVGVAALDATCDAFGVAPLDTPQAYATCLVRQHACHVVDLLRAQAPRADELLAAVGHELARPFCP